MIIWSRFPFLSRGLLNRVLLFNLSIFFHNISFLLFVIIFQRCFICLYVMKTLKLNNHQETFQKHTVLNLWMQLICIPKANHLDSKSPRQPAYLNLLLFLYYLELQISIFSSTFISLFWGYSNNVFKEF